MIEYFPALKDGISYMIHIISALGFPKMGPIALLCQDSVRIKKRTEEHTRYKVFAFLTLAESTRNRRKLQPEEISQKSVHLYGAAFPSVSVNQNHLEEFLKYRVLGPTSEFVIQ